MLCVCLWMHTAQLRNEPIRLPHSKRLTMRAETEEEKPAGDPRIIDPEPLCAIPSAKSR